LRPTIDYDAPLSLPDVTRDRPPRVSVVVVTYDAAAFVGPFVDALAALTYPDVEVVVVDNRSRDTTLDLVRRRLPTAIVVEPGQNLGFAAGCNVGASHAHGDVLLFLNPDTRPPADTVERLCLPLWQRPEIGVAGCRLVFPDGRIGSAGGLLEEDGIGQNRGWGERDQGQYDVESEVDYVPGAALAIRADLFAAIGGFCEDYFPGFYEDAELGLRVRRLGLRVLYLPAPTIVHLEGQSTGRRRSYWLHRNRLVFLLRTAYARTPVRGLLHETGWMWRNHVRPLVRALAGGHPWKALAAWRALRPVVAGDAVGLAVALRAWVSSGETGAWIVLQCRRLLWVLADLRLVLGGLGRAVAAARRPEPRLAVGVIEGEPVAATDCDNGYRIRLVNDTAEARDLTVRLRGEPLDGTPLETTTTCRVDAHAAHELFLVTDWRRRFEIAAAPVAVDERRALTPAVARRTCRLVATLAGDGEVLDRLAITQPLAS
jgi:GT2 family glycosyltransferase